MRADDEESIMDWVAMQKKLSEAEIRILGWELRHGSPAPRSWMEEAEVLRRRVRVLFEPVRGSLGFGTSMSARVGSL